MTHWLYPDFDQECRMCGTTPCVVVGGHPQPDTQLCGIHFFNDKEMSKWELWNEDKESD